MGRRRGQEGGWEKNETTRSTKKKDHQHATKASSSSGFLTFLFSLSFMFQIGKGGGITNVRPVAAAKATPLSRLSRMLLKPPRSFWSVTYFALLVSASGFRKSASLGTGKRGWGGEGGTDAYVQRIER